MLSRSRIILIISVCLIVIAAVFVVPAASKDKHPVNGAAKPALTVTTVQPESRLWSERLSATGTVQAWQEAIIGSETGGLRLAEVLVNVGDRVKKGAVLARFADEMVVNGIRQQQAALEEAQARNAEAQMNARRAEQLKSSGAMSSQDAQKFLTGALIAEAQMKLVGARLEAEKIRLRYTRVLAQDDGVISSRTATVGAVMQSGAEMFRLIGKEKMEWRAELSEQQLQQVHTGQKVHLYLTDTGEAHGVVARISPVIDAQTRSGTVYADLPVVKSMKAGMFAQGEIELGKSDALTIPQSSVVVRDGFSYVFKVAQDNRVEQVKVATGRRRGERIEITAGISPDTSMVGLGAGFLSDGDVVRIENHKPDKPKPNNPEKSAGRG